MRRGYGRSGEGRRGCRQKHRLLEGGHRLLHLARGGDRGGACSRGGWQRLRRYSRHRGGGVRYGAGGVRRRWRALRAHVRGSHRQANGTLRQRQGAPGGQPRLLRRQGLLEDAHRRAPRGGDSRRGRRLGRNTGAIRHAAALDSAGARHRLCRRRLRAVRPAGQVLPGSRREAKRLPRHSEDLHEERDALRGRRRARPKGLGADAEKDCPGRRRRVLPRRDGPRAGARFAGRGQPVHVRGA